MKSMTPWEQRPCWAIDAIGAAACIAVSFAAYVVILRPMQESRDSQAVRHAELAQQRSKLAESLTVVDSLKRELEHLEQAATINPVELRSVQYSNQRLAELTAMASEYTLNVDTLRTMAATPRSRFEIVPIHISGTGTFRTCTAFLHRIRQQFPDTGISVIELADNPSDASEKTSFVFHLTWYAASTIASASN